MSGRGCLPPSRLVDLCREALQAARVHADYTLPRSWYEAAQPGGRIAWPAVEGLGQERAEALSYAAEFWPPRLSAKLDELDLDALDHMPRGDRQALRVHVAGVGGLMAAGAASAMDAALVSGNREAMGVYLARVAQVFIAWLGKGEARHSASTRTL